MRILSSAVGPLPVLDRPNEGGAGEVLKEFEALHKDVRAALKDAGTKTGELDARMFDLEQKMARRGGGEPARPQSLGTKFIEQEGVKEFAHRGGKSDRVHFETKATLTSSTADAAGAVGAAIQPFRDPTIVPLPRRRPMVRDLLPTIQMSGGSVDVVVQTGRSENAGMVAEGAAKPSSDIKFAERNYPARVIAHWTKASRQVLSDLPQLQGIIDTELLDGLAIKEETQILYGDGTGQNLFGLVPQATAYSAPISISSPTSLDVIGLALLQTALANHPATGIIMHPADWTWITLLKDDAGNYIIGNPVDGTAPRLFGVPVIPSPAIAVDTFLVGNFTAAATLYDRWSARVELGYENDDFTRNLLTVLAEERLALALKDATAMVVGDFGRVA